MHSCVFSASFGGRGKGLKLLFEKLRLLGGLEAGSQEKIFKNGAI